MVIQAEQIQGILKQSFSDAEVTVSDMTGTNDHWSVVVLWEGFKGLSLIEQHKKVNEALAAPLQDGRIHALQIKTVCPAS